ncbi:Cys-tRNA(Pro) deacylase [Peptacetobacter sp.]|uniref:Cys-tRNA(Pro) deacylase n=1 Tax=Peptacetobacter sp. TaxID=2991975 RepID=UPI0026249855|nr:Cys-tRNA(Pro) deacylase [Peptacetobacter sp.]
MGKKVAKTNAMRILDKNKIEYNIREYPENGPVSALDVANYLGQPTDRIFKTLVTTDDNHGYYVFCLPGDKELDLKAGAKAVGVKKIEMLKQKDLFKLTGYIHGGCSPVGMKKLFPTVVDSSAHNFDTIYVSGGKIGMQIEINPDDLEKLINAKFAEIIKK